MKSISRCCSRLHHCVGLPCGLRYPIIVLHSGLVTVTEATIAASANIAGAVPRDKFLSALTDSLPKGAEITVR